MIAFALALVVSLGAVGLLRSLARRRGMLDVPQERSSHTTPTPRGGGLGLLIGIGVGLVAAGAMLGTASAAVASAALVAALAAVLTAALVGWLDDRRGLPVRWRLAAHLVAALLILPLVQPLAPPGWPAPLAMCWWAFWMVSSINVVNFMDGIDGLIGLQALVFGAFVAASASPHEVTQTLGLATAGASLGFLAWNWSPARIFLGDVGSGGLGALFVVAGALLVREGRMHFTAAFLPLAPIFLDASATLVRRWRRGERLSEAHRSHLYQRLANGGLGHARVALGYAAASAACAAIALGRPAGGIAQTLVVLVGLGIAGSACSRYFLRPPASAYHS